MRFRFVLVVVVMVVVVALLHVDLWRGVVVVLMAAWFELLLCVLPNLEKDVLLRRKQEGRNERTNERTNQEISVCRA